jgi:hypothetical protein
MSATQTVESPAAKQAPAPSHSNGAKRTRGPNKARPQVTKPVVKQDATPAAVRTVPLVAKVAAQRTSAIHPLAQGLADTILQAGPHWTKEQVTAFEGAVSGAMPVICAPA